MFVALLVLLTWRGPTLCLQLYAAATQEKDDEAASDSGPYALP